MRKLRQIIAVRTGRSLPAWPFVQCGGRGAYVAASCAVRSKQGEAVREVQRELSFQ